MPNTPAPDAHRVVSAYVTPPRSLDPAARAQRYGVLRRPGRGVIAGVCHALADGFGIPVRLVRATAIALGLLGPGAVLYLGLLLLLPRQRADAPARDAASERPPIQRIDSPWRALLERRAQAGDVVSLVLILPALAFANFMLWLFIAEFQIGLAFLLPLLLLLSIIVVLGGWQSSRARTAYLMSMLGERAGLVTDAELDATVDRLRRDAPRAWGVETAQGRVAWDEAERIRAGQLGPRASVLVLIAAMLAGIAAFSVVALNPQLVPALNPEGPLPLVARAGFAASVMLALLGVVLVVIGLRGRFDPRIVAAGFTCAAVLASSVVWVRLTDDRAQQPAVVHVTEYEPGTTISCAPGGLREWSRPIIIDLSDLPTPPSPADATARWQELNPGLVDARPDLSMTIVCNRPVGDVTVIPPPASWSVSSELTTELGRDSASAWQNGAGTPHTGVRIQLMGDLIVGDVRVEEQQ